MVYILFNTMIQSDIKHWLGLLVNPIQMQENNLVFVCTLGRSFAGHINSQQSNTQ